MSSVKNNLSEMLSNKCFWIGVVIAVGVIAVGWTLLYLAAHPRQSGSSVYFPGDNIADNITRFDNDNNKEYLTLAEMNRRAKALEIKKQAQPSYIDQSERISDKPIESNVAVTKADIDKVYHDQSGAAPAPGFLSTKGSAPPPAHLTAGQKAALKMYLNAPASGGVFSQFPEAMNDNVDPLYDIYRQ